jgi:hypothetical protein
VTAAATGRAPAGGAAIRARGWTPGYFVGKTVPEAGRPAEGLRL